METFIENEFLYTYNAKNKHKSYYYSQSDSSRNLQEISLEKFPKELPEEFVMASLEEFFIILRIILCKISEITGIIYGGVLKGISSRNFYEISGRIYIEAFF